MICCDASKCLSFEIDLIERMNKVEPSAAIPSLNVFLSRKHRGSEKFLARCSGSDLNVFNAHQEYYVLTITKAQ